MVEISYKGFGREGIGECYQHLPVPLLSEAKHYRDIVSSVQGLIGTNLLGSMRAYLGINWDA